MFLLLLNIVVDVTLYLHVLTWIFLHAGSVDPSSYVKEDPPWDAQSVLNSVLLMA